MRPPLPALVAGLLLSALGLAAGLTAVGAQAPARGNPDIQFAGQSIDAMIAAFMREQDVAGLSLAIVQAPYITRAAGFGVSDRERRTLVASDTLFNVAQMRNAFTAVAIMQLVEAGKLGLADPIRRHLADADSRETVRQLLRRPGAYPLLERLVAQASGQSYQEFVRRGQIEPLGLEHTVFGDELAALPREQLRPGDRHRRFLHEPALIAPAEPATGYRQGRPVAPADAALYASAYDVSVWEIALAGDILVKDPALHKILYAPATLENGQVVPTSGPWFFPGHDGLMVATSSGEGFSALLSRFTRADELVGVTLLANREGLDLTQLARRIAGAHDARLGPPARAAGMRVQQSPYPVAETLTRLERALRDRSVVTAGRVDGGKAGASLNLTPPRTDQPLRATAWEEGGEVWLAVPDPVEPARRDGAAAQVERALGARALIDAALLQAVTSTSP